MPFGIKTQEDLMNILMDPSQFKSLAAEAAQNSGPPPGLENFNIQEFKTQMAASQGIVPGGDIDASQATTAGVAGQQANVQAQGQNAPGGVATPGAPFDVSQLAQGLGGASQAIARPPQAALRPTRVGEKIQGAGIQMPGGGGSDPLAGLVELLARR